MEQYQNEKHFSTEDKILLAAIDLMEQKGYKAVTTKEIATKAGFSEMTLFRHFGTKRRLLDAAVERYSYIVDMNNILKTNVTYDLITDLTMVSKTYHHYLKHNQKIVILAFQERNTNPSIGEKTAENPKKLKEYLIEYFKEMQRQDKILSQDPEILAMNFLWLNLGYFMASFISGDKVAVIPESIFIEESVKTFVRGICKEEVYSLY
ncbi:TetR/AcrR family transcriptional regulator [Evansella sp. AB-P1]|uniref:TetR/AcrR family transcriptional regulator n=1 Tax=Evansella sp. AB-P1 TaxID=3037653 RepID=UPI00241E7345|nr:TetR/AcrR family transcriptional regulator [Evansella sp. AB-P1]MDG5789220.1 TetR/AcrR family transcriptional regulator [Evansella sp. AB-P1]